MRAPNALKPDSPLGLTQDQFTPSSSRVRFSGGGNSDGSDSNPTTVTSHTQGGAFQNPSPYADATHYTPALFQKLAPSSVPRRFINLPDTCSIYAAQNIFSYLKSIRLFSSEQAINLDDPRQIMTLALTTFKYLPPAKNDIEAYCQLMSSILAVENGVRGFESVVHPKKVYSASLRMLYKLDKNLPLQDPLNHEVIQSGEEILDMFDSRSLNLWSVCLSPYDLIFINNRGDLYSYRRFPNFKNPDGEFNQKEIQHPSLHYNIRGGHVFHKNGFEAQRVMLQDSLNFQNNVTGLALEGAFGFFYPHAQIHLKKDENPNFYGQLRQFIKNNDLVPKNGNEYPNEVKAQEFLGVQWGENDLKQLKALLIHKDLPKPSTALEALALLQEVIYGYGFNHFNQNNAFIKDAKEYLLYGYLFPVKDPNTHKLSYLILNPSLPFFFMLDEHGGIQGYFRKPVNYLSPESLRRHGREVPTRVIPSSGSERGVPFITLDHPDATAYDVYRNSWNKALSIKGDFPIWLDTMKLHNTLIYQDLPDPYPVMTKYLQNSAMHQIAKSQP